MIAGLSTMAEPRVVFTMPVGQTGRVTVYDDDDARLFEFEPIRLAMSPERHKIEREIGDWLDSREGGEA